MKPGDLVMKVLGSTARDDAGLGLVIEGSAGGYYNVQWFDWDNGDIAIENPDALVLVSKANEAR